ncbi:class F sortase [Actinoplanes sp. TBRC 11911]|nr:class F sortase [Actinoplanes sp. TBRC 11911]
MAVGGAPGVPEIAVDGAPGVPRKDVEAAPHTPAAAVRDKPKRGLLLPALAGAVAAVLAGGGYLAATHHQADREDLGRWAVAPPAASDPARPSGDPFATVAAAPQGPPTRVRIAAINLDTTLESLRLGRDGALQPPKSFGRAGWYADGTAPGDTGPAVIAGHVDSKSGPAIFYRLRELTVGDHIDVTRGGTIVRFTVTATAWYPKTKFPASWVYGPTPDRQLRLITCGGVFDHSLRSYKDNLVVYAVSG